MVMNQNHQKFISHLFSRSSRSHNTKASCNLLLWCWYLLMEFKSSMLFLVWNSVPPWMCWDIVKETKQWQLKPSFVILQKKQTAVGQVYGIVYAIFDQTGSYICGNSFLVRSLKSVPILTCINFFDTYFLSCKANSAMEQHCFEFQF